MAKICEVIGMCTLKLKFRDYVDKPIVLLGYRGTDCAAAYDITQTPPAHAT